MLRASAKSQSLVNVTVSVAIPVQCPQLPAWPACEANLIVLADCDGNHGMWR